MKIALLRAVSQNAVLTRLSEGLAAGLAAAGAQIALVDPSGEAWVQGLVQRIQAERFDYVFSFGSFTAELRASDGRSGYDVLDTGFIGWDVDHPAYQWPRFSTAMRRRVQVCASEAHVRYARAIGLHAAPCVMLPGVSGVAEAPAPFSRRRRGLVVAASWMGEPERWWDEAKGTPADRLVGKMVEMLMADPEADLLAALESASRIVGLSLPLDESANSIIANVGLYIRRRDRMAVMEALAASDLPCLVVGRGWRERLAPRAGLEFADDQSFDSLGDLYGDARVALNLNAANGASERAVQAMAAGAAVASDYSSLIDAQFGREEAVRFFDRRKPSSVVDVVRALLDGEDEGVAERGRAAVAAAHLWPHKAEQLMAVLRTQTPGA